MRTSEGSWLGGFWGFGGAGVGGFGVGSAGGGNGHARSISVPPSEAARNGHHHDVADVGG
jgi:hypothetical protein